MNMVHIKVTRGLDIPIAGKPSGSIQNLIAPQQVALNLACFEDIKFKVFIKQGDEVCIGQPLAEDKNCPGRMFVSPAGGVIKEIRRGLKRRLLAIVIDVAKEEKEVSLNPINIKMASKEEILERLKVLGLFAHIRSRPFNGLANPHVMPRSIFVKALESAPFAPDCERQVSGKEREFQAGLEALSKLIQGKVHLVYREGTSCKAFSEALFVEKHTAEGPHPVANSSVHIHYIDPIQKVEDVVWTLTAHDVVCIGYALLHGKYLVEKLISIAGNGIVEGKRGFFKGRAGYPIGGLVAGRNDKGHLRLISGDVLTGTIVQMDDFLGFYDTVFSVIPENVEREFLHFFRLGIGKYSASKAYFSGFIDPSKQEFDFTTNQHGENRAFIDASVYERVMPMQIPTMHLVKAVLAEDFELAEELGLLEVDSEDFALPTFVCPSKVEMMEIVREGLRRYAKEVLQ